MRTWWFRRLWQLSNLARIAISSLPFILKSLCCEIIAALVYWPLARLALVSERLGLAVENLPLSAYRTRSFYVMRNDALDRFGTSFERRFTRAEMERMMVRCGLENIHFSDTLPFWCAVGYRNSK